MGCGRYHPTRPLNPSAAAFAVLLVTDLEGDFAQAVEIGLRGLTCAPHHQMLVNNTAYAMALAGERLASTALCRPMTWIVCQRLVRERQIDMVEGSPDGWHEYRLPDTHHGGDICGFRLPPKDSKSRKRGRLPPSKES